MIERILKKFKYVQNLETDKAIFMQQYTKANEHVRDVLECCNEQQEVINELKADKDRMESLFSYTVRNMHMIFGVGDGRHINITDQGLQEAAGMQIDVRVAGPLSGISVYSVRK